MKIGSLSEYLEALLAVENYYFFNTTDKLLEEFKNIFPLGMHIYDEDENYLGDVVSWEISNRDKFILHLEYNEQIRSVQVKSIERTLSSKSEIPITKMSISSVIKWAYAPVKKCSVLAHRIIKSED